MSFDNLEIGRNSLRVFNEKTLNDLQIKKDFRRGARFVQEKIKDNNLRDKLNFTNVQKRALFIATGNLQSYVLESKGIELITGKKTSNGFKIDSKFEKITNSLGHICRAYEDEIEEQITEGSKYIYKLNYLEEKIVPYYLGLCMCNIFADKNKTLDVKLKNKLVKLTTQLSEKIWVENKNNPDMIDKLNKTDELCRKFCKSLYRKDK